MKNKSEEESKEGPPSSEVIKLKEKFPETENPYVKLTLAKQGDFKANKKIKDEGKKPVIIKLKKKLKKK